MSKTVSIIIPAYNSEKYISEAIESAINQTWQHKEIIVIDDGSADNTYSVACSYKKEGVEVLQQKNKGACAARNLGIKHSKGDYIQLLDSDDILLPQKISSQIELCNETDVVFCKTIAFKDGQNPFDKTIPIVEKSYEIFLSDIILRHIVVTSTLLASKMVFEKFGVFDERLRRAQEHDVNIRLLANGVKYIYDGSHNVLARQHNSPHRISNSKTSKNRDSDLIFLSNTEENIDKYIAANNCVDNFDLINEFCRLIIFFAQSYGNIKDFDTVKLFEKYLLKMKNKYNFKQKVMYKSKFSYNALLEVLGLTNFERLRKMIK